ncbi:Acyl-CoA dehydrogenase [hydrothermal vent metagenome]|uniref:Acyl-CoA dehydrogenase n=1 Tax=hydrothermal vent metagenome TaxID=652676 RepID=A0A3B0S4C1_9ZZZZ
MNHYKTNLRDIEFNLFEFLKVGDWYGTAPFDAFDEDTAGDALREVERLSREEFATSFVEADRTELELVDGKIALPDSVKASLDALYDGDWHLLGIDPELGGFGAPGSLRWATSEFFVGANPGVFLYASGGLMAKVIATEGTEEQKETWARWLIENRWGATMVLTEPDAGSDVGAGTSKAIHVEGDTYHLEGVKRFITSGENDYFDNIVHLVLARREGGEPGTKGLSMFIVPKYLVNEDGSLGERNGIYATSLEHKMGIRGSTTTELTMGTDEPCVGYLVGGVHEGIRQMFLVIEDARMMIGVKSAATLSTGYLNALAYAGERVQSPDMAQMADKTAPKVEIIRHPDVRRMLMLQKAYSEGLRALWMYTAMTLDKMQLNPDDAYWAKLNDLLLPMVKGYSSEKAYELLATSLQVFGGAGFTVDYPIEQYIRDAKIDTLYEGTTAIQGLDLFFRKIARDKGQTLMKLAEQILEYVKGGSDEFSVERQALGAALEQLQSHVGVLVGYSMASMQEPKEIYKAGLHTNTLLESLSEIVISWLLLEQAEIAAAKLPETTGSDTGFYTGKVASARFFVKDALPKVAIRTAAAQSEDAWLMDLPDEAF